MMRVLPFFVQTFVMFKVIGMQFITGGRIVPEFIQIRFANKGSSLHAMMGLGLSKGIDFPGLYYMIKFRKIYYIPIPRR